MSQIPNLFPEAYREENRGILRKMEDFYTESFMINQAFCEEADIDTRFEAGDQTLWTVGGPFANKGRQLHFNRIRPMVNMVSGCQRRNRMSTIVTPMDNGDQETADQFSKVMIWINNSDNVLETISEAFHGALVTGMNLLHTWVDYRSDPVSGNIRVDSCPYNTFVIDPFFKKQDLSDCNGILRRSYISKKQVASLLPDKRDEILSLEGKDSQDGKFINTPENYRYSKSKLLTYDEFYYKDFRPQRLLIDTDTGATLEWKGTDDDALGQFLSMYPQITVFDQEIQTVRLAIVVQGKVMYDGPNPMGIDKYPFVPVIGYYNPQIPYFPLRVQGIVRAMRDPQFVYNRRIVMDLDYLEAGMVGGIKFKEGALVNPKDAFLNGNGRVLAVSANAQMSDVEQLQPPAIPPTTLEVTERLGRTFSEVTGINEELMGSAVDDKAGVLAMLRQGAGLTTLQTVFDQLNRSQKLLGNLMIDLIQSNFSPGKISRIIEAEPSPQFYNKAFGKYDCVVEEGLNTSTQRQMQFAQLLQLREAGVPVPDSSLLDAATIQNKKELIQAMEKEKQAASEMQQFQIQTAMEETKARTNLANKRAYADESLGNERNSRIPENRAEAIQNLEEAEKDKFGAILNLVKAVKEIEGIEIDQIIKVIQLADQLKNNTAASVSPTNLV